MYPDMARICHNHGYALAAHGSLATGLDVIVILRVAKISSPIAALAVIIKEFSA
jgi:hypothetical protein